MTACGTLQWTQWSALCFLGFDSLLPQLQNEVGTVLKWPLSAFAKWLFFAVSPFRIIKRSEKSACVSHKKEKLGRVQMLIIYSNFCVYCWKRDAKAVTLSDEILSDSRRRSQSLGSNDDCNHSCGEDWDKDGSMKVMGQVSKPSHWINELL